MGSNYQILRLLSKKLYKNFKKQKCPALQNEIVHFNSIGFNHLVRKGKKMRPISDQMRRFKILPQAIVVLANGKLSEHRIIQSTKIIKFWTISYEIDDNNLNVIVIQEGNGQKNFLSITK